MQREISINSYAVVTDGGVDSVKSSARQALVTIVQVATLSPRRTLVDSTEFQLLATFPLESRRTDASIFKRQKNDFTMDLVIYSHGRFTVGNKAITITHFFFKLIN